MREGSSILDSAGDRIRENKYQRSDHTGKGQGDKFDEKEIVAMLYRYQRANLRTQNREERDRRGEEIKCGKTSSIYRKLVQKKIPNDH